jgi:hypothetical protein
VFAGGLAAVLAGNVSAAARSPSVRGGGEVAGRGYGQWVIAAWRWRVALPALTAPSSCITMGQRGPDALTAGRRSTAIAAILPPLSSGTDALVVISALTNPASTRKVTYELTIG